jgi:predicted nucleic acid-binding Zn ribbon protein
VDSVDNTVNGLSPGVTKRPNEGSDPPSGQDRSSDRSRSDTKSEPCTGPNEGSGRDLVRAALEAARQKANARGHEPGVSRASWSGGRSGGPGSGSGQRQNPRRRRWSGPGGDQRDPQPLGRIASRLAVERGWNTRLATGQVFGQWARLVGEEVAEHAQPISLRDGELSVQATSTAWATQLRLLQGQLLVKIAGVVGNGVVKRMRIQGPAAPSWRKGPRHVSGRGPRDTYG